MHNAVYEELGLDWVYVPLAVADEVGLRRLVAAIRSLPFVGFNVTMPYKAAILELCDEVATAASMAGAVNTVHCIGRSAHRLQHRRPRAARDALDGRRLRPGRQEASSFWVQEVRLAARSSRSSWPVRPRSPWSTGTSNVPKSSLDSAWFSRSADIQSDAVTSADAEDAVREADLVINATSVGMRPGDPCSDSGRVAARRGRSCSTWCTARRSPRALVARRARAGATTLDGLGMLVCQGATAVDIWNSSSQVRTPRDVMREAARRELAERTRAR